MSHVVIFPAVADGTRFPTSRSQGRARRIQLDEALTGKASVDLRIDFSDVHAMTISYVDEFLAKFMTSFDGAENDITIMAQGLNTENAEAVQIALERRHTGIVVLNEDGTLALLGDPRLGETFRAASKVGAFKAHDLARRLGISPQNANNRLRPLVEVGALRKSRVTGATRGGKEFAYTAVTEAASDSDVA
jgi:hypothetical protein